jgi:putative ABC transport system permease protein
LTFGAVALLLGVVSVLAAYLPARSAARIDPAVALRAE